MRDFKHKTVAGLRDRITDAQYSLKWNEERLPPPITVKQFFALLDELCTVGCCSRDERDDERVYVISESEIHEGDLILEGNNRATGDPLRRALLAVIGQLHTIDVDLQEIGKSLPPELLGKTREEIRNAAAKLHLQIYDDLDADD